MHLDGASHLLVLRTLIIVSPASPLRDSAGVLRPKSQLFFWYAPGIFWFLFLSSQTKQIKGISNVCVDLFVSCARVFFFYTSVITCTAVHAQKVCLCHKSPFYNVSLSAMQFLKSFACINKILFHCPCLATMGFWGGSSRPLSVGGRAQLNFTTLAQSFQRGKSFQPIRTRKTSSRPERGRRLHSSYEKSFNLNPPKKIFGTNK